MTEKVMVLSCPDCSFKKVSTVDMKRENSGELERQSLEKARQEHMTEYGHIDARIEEFERPKRPNSGETTGKMARWERSLANQRRAEESKKKREKVHNKFMNAFKRELLKELSSKQIKAWKDYKKGKISESEARRKLNPQILKKLKHYDSPEEESSSIFVDSDSSGRAHAMRSD